MRKQKTALDVAKTRAKAVCMITVIIAEGQFRLNRAASRKQIPIDRSIPAANGIINPKPSRPNKP
jgi:hypothetical protein